MIIYCVSDVHIKKERDPACLLFWRFLEECERADVVVLLGDIFDLLVGGHQDWKTHYPETFSRLNKLAEEKPVYYLEGNHDFHLQYLFESLSPVRHQIEDLVLKQNQYIIRFSHGDDVEIDNQAYQKYKRIIRSRFVALLANEFVPVKWIASIGARASQASAKRSLRYEVNAHQQQLVRQKFRLSADDYYEKAGPFNVLICGHSHVKDCWRSKKGFLYANNGYFMAEKTFAIIENGEVQFKAIN